MNTTTKQDEKDFQAAIELLQSRRPVTTTRYLSRNYFRDRILASALNHLWRGQGISLCLQPFNSVEHYVRVTEQQ